MTRFARAINSDGDVMFDRARGTWVRATSPELAIVRNVLSTPLGSAARDRSYGVEGVENATPNAAAVWRQNVLRALRRWIDRGVLRNVEVVSELRTPPEGARLDYVVSFHDKSGVRRSLPNTRPL